MLEILVELIAALRSIGWMLLVLMGLAALSVTAIVCASLSISRDARQQATKLDQLLREVRTNQP